MKLKDKARITAAKMMAKMAHRWQKYGNGEPYYQYHVLGVAEEFKGNPDYYITALLHDVIEDSGFKLEDIEAAFGKTVARAVLFLTHLKETGETYDEYIDYIVKMRHTPAGRIAIEVKIADAKFNLIHCEIGSKRADKYILAIFKLEAGGDNEQPD